jgi:hypothetical protein
MFKKRKECEEIVYKVMDILDPSGENSSFYKKKFAKLNDKEFIKFFEQDFPLKFQTKLFEIEPNMDQIDKALKFIGVPMMEKINMPFLYENKDGVPVKSEDTLTVYVSLKKMKQFVSKKNSNSTNISSRDMKSGLLISIDKNGNTSDREFEALAVLSADKTMKELSTFRADAMDAKSEFYSIINTTGIVRLDDVKLDTKDSLARNYLNVWLLGAGINSNLINEGDYIPRTIDDKELKINRK